MDKLPKYYRGSIWYFQGDNKYEPGVLSGSRPVLIISNDKFNTYSGVVNCLPITSSIKDSPVHIGIKLKVKSQIQCEQIYTVSQSRLIRFMGDIIDSKLQEVERKLLFQLDLVQSPELNNPTVDVDLDVQEDQ